MRTESEHDCPECGHKLENTNDGSGNFICTQMDCMQYFDRSEIIEEDDGNC